MSSVTTNHLEEQTDGPAQHRDRASRASKTPWWAALSVACCTLSSVLAGCVGEQTATSTPNPGQIQWSDADGDTLLDVDEGAQDTDLDGTPDYLDTESDGDGIPDAVEAGDAEVLTAPFDADGDLNPDFRDLDADDNGIPDAIEAGINPGAPLDLDRDGVEDFRDADNDGDGISDVIELGSAQPLDTDDDGIDDYLDTDSDADSIADVDEARLVGGTNPGDFDQDTAPNYRDTDSDGDGFTDREESGDSDPATAPRDTDVDGNPDFLDLDSDGDAVLDAEEATFQTNPLLYDTDGDGFSDGGELLAGSNPLLAGSTPAGLYWVVPQRSRVDATFEFTAEIGRADILFLLDSTGSMGPTLTTLADNFASVVTTISSQIPDAAFGVTTFADYNYAGMGGGTDRPFVLRQQLSTNLGAVQAALNALSAGGGGDSRETAMEALYQAMTGRGYDQDCDARWDSATDVAPFISSLSDVFEGTAADTYQSDDLSTGTTGGVGFRRYALPVLIWTTDTDYRDPDNGDPVPEVCSSPAGSKAVSATANGLGARLIGVNAGEEAILTEHMEALASATSSTADVDGDGLAEPLVFSSKGGQEIVDAIVQGVGALHQTGEFNEVELRVEDDPYGFVSTITPASYTRVRTGMTLTFTLSLFGAAPASTDDQLFELTLVVVGDGSTSLDTARVLILVPGSGSSARAAE